MSERVIEHASRADPEMKEDWRKKAAGTELESWTTRWSEIRDSLLPGIRSRVLVMASPDGEMAVAITPWTSTGFHEDGTAFERPGRATIVLSKQPDGRWLGVHSHMSLARGVPQDSHGRRSVKAR